MDLNTEKQAQTGRLVREVCERLNISRQRVRGVVASPPCNSFTKLDAVNVERGNNFREPMVPFAPRKDDGTEQSKKLGQIAHEHDEMVRNLINQFCRIERKACCMITV